MKISEVVGIDVSKLVIDVRIHSNQKYEQFENSNKGFKKMCKWAFKNSPYQKEETLFIFEHTGMYSYNLSVYLSKQEIDFSMVAGLEVKRSLGITRGKNDRIDAKKLARYGYRLRDEIKPYMLPGEELERLKRLLSLRNRLVKQNAGYKTSLTEWKRVLIQKQDKVLFDTQEKMIKYITKRIAVIENEIMEIIASNEGLKKQYEQIISIKSVGPQTALYLIVYTAGFTKFENSRKFASYCGIAPFSNTSGTSVRGRTKVSNLANKKIKSLLDQCAKNAILHNPEMRIYYEKRVEQGKEKMSTINIVRNKILARIFAVANRETPYVEIYKYAA